MNWDWSCWINEIEVGCAGLEMRRILEYAAHLSEPWGFDASSDGCVRRIICFGWGECDASKGVRRIGGFVLGVVRRIK